MKVGRRFLVAIAIFVLISFSAFTQSVSPEQRDKADLQTWSSVMEMFQMDDGVYPQAGSIFELAQKAKVRKYWEEPAVYDLNGNPYQALSSADHFRIGTDTIKVESQSTTPATQSAKPEHKTAKQKSAAANSIRSVANTLLVSKTSGGVPSPNGPDIRLTWGTTGTLHAGSWSTDPQFLNAHTLFLNNPTTSYDWKQALTKHPEKLMFFDVTDETEGNRAGNWNGGVMPPPPPAIDPSNPATNINALFVGSNGTIGGSDFSTIPSANGTCFNGGVCTAATSATTTQISFTTPPGAVSGDITVTIGNRSSDPQTAIVNLEDTASGWTIRTSGFSDQDMSYWMAGNSTVDSLFRVYYDDPAKEWLKTDQGGIFSATLMYCSTHSTRSGYLYCGYATVATGGGGTRRVLTNPAGTLANCINLGGSGSNTNVRGAAADPNPDAVAGRDVVYFAHANTSTVPPTYNIKKVAADCSAVLDSNYGNTNWNPNWGAIVGLTVDPVTGDLYIVARTAIYRIATDETVTLIKGGFTSGNGVFGIDISRQGPNDPGFLVFAYNGLSQIQAIALDNLPASPLLVAAASVARAVVWGATVATDNWDPASVNRRVVVHNNGNSGAVDPVRPDPFISVLPGSAPVHVRISSPPPDAGFGKGPYYQPYVHSSEDATDGPSLAEVFLYYNDGKDRPTCAWIGDAGKANVGYEPDPPNPLNCNTPRIGASGPCDNKDDLVAGGVGSFTDSNDLVSCQASCGGTNACYWTFQITERYGGDNSMIFFSNDNPPTFYYRTTSARYDAEKHVHIEPDRMCRRGGVLDNRAGNAGGDADALPDSVHLRVWNPALPLSDSSYPQVGNALTVFDSVNTFESGGQTALVNATSFVILVDRLALKIDLSADLANTYIPSPTSEMSSFDFQSGNSAGACVASQNFFAADTSDLRQPFDDGFVSFHVSKYGENGSGIIPYVPLEFFDAPTYITNLQYLNQIWFANKKPTGPGLLLNEPHNYFHLVGVSAHTGSYGDTISESDVSYVYIQNIEQLCGADAACLQNLNQSVTDHETVHHFSVNEGLPCVGGHDPKTPNPSNNAWCGDPGGSCANPNLGNTRCLMSGQPVDDPLEFEQFTDGFNSLDCEDLGLEDPPAVPPACVPLNSNDCGLGIRTQTDPQ